MRHHARIPAFLAAALTAALGLSALYAGGLFAPGPNSDLIALEKQIAAGTADAGTWQSYGDTLRTAHRFGHAAAAYRRALELQPDLRDARLNLGLSLGQASNSDTAGPDAFFAFINDLMLSEPKLAVDILDRQELAPLRADARFAPVYQNAKAQAAD